MSRKLAIILLLIIVGPSVAVLWLGYRLAIDEQEMVEHRYRTVLEQRLSDVSQRIAEHLETRRRDLITHLRLVYDSETMRKALHEDGTWHTGFMVAPDGRLRYPDPMTTLTRNEQDFLARTSTLWDSGLLAAEAVPETQPHSNSVKQLKVMAQQAAFAPQQAQIQMALSNVGTRSTSSGWLPWYSADGMSLLCWTVSGTGQILGAELGRSRLIAEIIGILPTTDTAGASLQNASIVIRDAHNQLLYQWGGYRRKDKEKAQAILPLAAPLSSWHLEYYEGAGATGRGRRTALFSVLVTSGAFALVLAALGFYFYREHTRQVRLAEQRVSFVNQVSHELKTPLTNIRMYAELLQDRIGEPEDERIRRGVSVIIQESQRLSRLIANVLTFGRHQRKQISLHITEQSVDAVVSSVVENFSGILGEREIEVELDQAADSTVKFDRDVLEQILGNLLSNVEKYAAAGKWVRIETRLQGDNATITVSDRGPGIPAAARGKVFEPFVRVNDSITEGISGTGIGLTIARELARLHGGDLVLLRAESQSGCTFQVQIKVEHT